MAQNRVTPFGVIEDLPGRGTLMGNRGILHDGTERRIRRRWTNKAWIACALEYTPASHRTAQEGRRAPMWENRRWTPLFFLDEATALAAGHRPCALCRRADHRRFRAVWGDAPLKEIDATLHAQRTAARGEVRRDDLIDGAMVAFADRAWLVWHARRGRGRWGGTARRMRSRRRRRCSRRRRSSTCCGAATRCRCTRAPAETSRTTGGGTVGV